MSRVKASEVQVERLADGRVRLTTGGWSDVFDEDRREKWARWYADMAERYDNDRHARIAAALRALPNVKAA